MKKMTFLLIAIPLLMGACKKVNNRSMTVVKDCTGTYLRADNKDYHVCNLEATAIFANGAKVTATYKKIDKCDGSASKAFVCAMLHENEGWIEVKDIK